MAGLMAGTGAFDTPRDSRKHDGNGHGTQGGVQHHLQGGPRLGLAPVNLPPALRSSD